VKRPRRPAARAALQSPGGIAVAAERAVFSRTAGRRSLAWMVGPTLTSVVAVVVRSAQMSDGGRCGLVPDYAVQIAQTRISILRFHWRSSHL
jgi:hypothetical protein